MAEKQTFDVVVVGGGNNGLAAGAYLARAGLSVAVLELREVVGGAATTEEVTVPGFKHNLHAAYMLVIYDVHRQLELEKYGCKIVQDLEGGASHVFADGRCMHFFHDLDRQVEHLATFSKHDAQMWYDMAMTYKDTAPMWNIGILPVRGMLPSIPYQIFESTPQGRDLLQMMQNSARNVCNNLFEDDHLKAALYCYVSQSVELPDDIMGTGALVVLRFAQMGAQSAAEMAGSGIAIGGTGTVTQALARNITAHGGKVFTNANVVKVTVGNGVAKSAILEDGTEFIAKKAMISGVNHQLMLIDMVGEENLDAHFAAKVKRWRWAETVLFTPHLAFSEPLVWKCSDYDPDIQKSWGVGVYPDPPDAFEQQNADIRAKKVPSEVTILGVFPTVVDPSQAPPGCSTALLWQYAGYELEGGPEKWDDHKEELADRIMDLMQKCVKNDLKKITVGRYVQSPMDVVRRNPSMRGGSFAHGSLANDQVGIFRPYSDYEVGKSPFENLYMAGDWCGCSGVAGRNAAELCLEDLKMKKWWLE